MFPWYHTKSSSSVMRPSFPQLFRRSVALARAHASLLLVLGVALGHRIAFLRWWKAFPGGDTYNFILIAQELLRGSYPVAEKRLPVYPILIALTRSVTDWETAAIAVAMAASLIAVLLLYAIGRTIGLSKTALVVGLLPFQTIAPFLFQSIRGYADTTFVALMLGAILAFLRMRTRRGAALAGALAGAASLTRPEGIVLVPTIILLALISRRRALAVPVAAAALLTWVPFLLVSVKAGRPLLPAEYLADAEETAFGVTTARAFAANYAAIWKSIGADRLWGEPLRLFRDASTLTLDALPRRINAFFTDPKEFPSLLLLAGLVFLSWKKPRFFLPIVFLFFAVALPIAWWGVRQRFLIVLYPLPFLILAAGADTLLTLVGSVARWTRSRMLPDIAALALLLLSFLSWTPHNAAEAREVQEKILGKDYAYYQAIQEARTLPGNIAFEHRSSIALALFGEPDRGRAIFAETLLNTPDPPEQWDALQKWHVRYLVVHGTTSAAFPVLSDPAFADRFTVVRSFQHPQKRGGPDHATIYEVLP